MGRAERCEVVFTAKRMSSALHRGQIEVAFDMEAAAAVQGVVNTVVPEIIPIKLPARFVTGMEFGMSLLTMKDPHIVGGDGVQSLSQPHGRQLSSIVKVSHLPICVHAGIGSAGPVNFGALPDNLCQSVRQLTLDRPHIGLDLKAVERTTVIGDQDAESFRVLGRTERQNSNANPKRAVSSPNLRLPAEPKSSTVEIMYSKKM